jgi:hypothetical protein
LYVFALGCFLLLSVNLNYDAYGIVNSWEPHFHITELPRAMTYLNKGLGIFYAQTTGRIVHLNSFTIPYLIDLCSACVPLLLLVLHGAYAEFPRNLRKSEPLIFAAVIGSLLVPFSLFFFQDWGRWIHLITLHTFIFLVMLNNLGMVAYKAIPPPSKYYLAMYSILFVFYTMSWRMPHSRP